MLQLNNKLITCVSGTAPKVRTIKNLLTEGANINYNTKEGYTPLMLAAKGKHDRIVEYLLKQGANPFLKNHEHNSASELMSSNLSTYTILKDHELLYATMNNDLTTVIASINSGAWVNFQGAGDYTALMIAVEQNSIEMVEYLLLQGANLLLTRTDGQTVFQMTKDTAIIDLLETANNLNLDISENQVLTITPEKRKLHAQRRNHTLF